ncbi:MAG: hypothetical protein ACPGVN_00945 [Alphaproteobacteria bacterium]
MTTACSEVPDCDVFCVPFVLPVPEAVVFDVSVEFVIDELVPFTDPAMAVVSELLVDVVFVPVFVPVVFVVPLLFDVWFASPVVTVVEDVAPSLVDSDDVVVPELKVPVCVLVDVDVCSLVPFDVALPVLVAEAVSLVELFDTVVTCAVAELATWKMSTELRDVEAGTTI